MRVRASGRKKEVRPHVCTGSPGDEATDASASFKVITASYANLILLGWGRRTSRLHQTFQVMSPSEVSAELFQKHPPHTRLSRTKSDRELEEIPGNTTHHTTTGTRYNLEVDDPMTLRRTIP
jgi:hypothetical protein